MLQFIRPRPADYLLLLLLIAAVMYYRSTGNSVNCNYNVSEESKNVTAPHTSKTVPQNYSLPMCFGILAFEGVKTLDNSLASYSNILNRIAEVHILFQEIDSSSRRAWADDVVHRYPALIPMFMNKNVGQKEGFLRLAEACMSSFLVVIEEDFTIDDTAAALIQLEHGVKLLSNSTADAVRLRSRRNPGHPNHAHLTFIATGKLGDTHMIEHVVWNDKAEESFGPIRICHELPKTWCAQSPYAQYTNNPTLYRTDFAQNLFRLPNDGADFEPWLTKYWTNQNYTVAYSDGVFTHNRLDRVKGVLNNITS